MPIGWILGIMAGFLHWFSELFLVIGFFTRDASHSQEWADKYPEWEDRLTTMNNFSHPDSAPMILDRLEQTYNFQFWLVAEGLLESMACVAAICCLMALKAQMNYRRPADEREMVMYACFLIGLLIPLLEFCMRVGPYSFVGWVGSEIAKDCPDYPDCSNADPDQFKVFSGFTDAHIQMMQMSLQVVESLFSWLNVLADLLLGLGFFQLSFIGHQRAKVIIDDRTRLLGLWTAGLFFICFGAGILRESSTIVGDGGWVLFDMIGTAFSAVLGIFLVPAYFLFLGIGLGKVVAVEDLNRDLSEAVTYIGEATASDVAEGTKAAKAMYDAARQKEKEDLKRWEKEAKAEAAETENPVAEGSAGAGEETADS